MPRIIAGAARGRRLGVPTGGATRPTSDRAREGLFSSLQTLVGELAGTRVLDLYAGSGAVGLEALSRGAGHVLLVENDPRAARTLRANVTTVGLPGVRVREATVARVLADPPDAPYDVVFADPPYSTPPPSLATVLSRLVDGGWLAPDGVLVLERATRDGEPAWPEGLGTVRERRYGEATLWYGRAATAG